MWSEWLETTLDRANASDDLPPARDRRQRLVVYANDNTDPAGEPADAADAMPACHTD